MNEARAAALTGWPPRLALSLKRRLPRGVLVVAGVFAALYLAYVVAANVILRTRLLRDWLGTDPAALRLDYASAWSPYPGRVLVRDLSLRFQDDNVQFLLELDRASIGIDLFALARRTFHVTELDAEGASFRLRHKVSTSQGQEGRLAAYPPIEGFADPPVRAPDAEETSADESDDLWEIRLEDVRANVRELWIMEYRYRGDGSISGSMMLRPKKELSVGDSVLVTRDGSLSIGDDEVLLGSDTRLEARVDAYDVRAVHGAAVLRKLTARAEMHGQTTDIAPFGKVYLSRAPVTLAGGRGRFSASLRIDRGVVHPDTRIEWTSDAVTVRAGGAHASGDLTAIGRIEPGRGGPTAGQLDPAARPALVLELAAKRLRAATGDVVLARLEDAAATIATANTDLAGSFPFSSAKLDVASARASDLASAVAALSSDVRVAGGSAEGSLHVSYREGALDARSDVAWDGVRVESPKVGVAASGGAALVATSKDVRTGISFDGSRVTLKDAAVRIGDAREAGLAVAVEVRDGLVRTGGARGLATTFDVSVAPGDRVLRLGAAVASLPRPLAEAPAGADARAAVRIHAGPRGLDVRVLEARDGDLVVHGRVERRPAARASGAFLFELGPVRVGVEIAGGETRVRPLASRAWLEERTQ